MQQTVEPNKTLLVNGPASIKLASGKAEVFGYQVKEAQKILVRQGKCLPFFVLDKAVFDISLGPSASVKEADGNTVPSSWGKVVEAVLGIEKRPAVVLVLGQADSGKSSFCTYLFNKLLDGKRRVAVLDGDLGQSDIGPSATVGYATTAKPQTELYNLGLENAFFVGVTSPVAAIARTIDGLNAMKEEILKRPVDSVIINTDGLVTGELAVKYKTALFNAVKPDIIIGIQVQDELAALIANRNAPTYVVEPSPIVAQRTPEERKTLREMTYARYLKDAKLQCYPMSQLTVEPKNAVPKTQDADKGLLVGLYGFGNKFLGVGVLRDINPTRRVLKVQTGVAAKPARLVIGKVVLNQKLQEIQQVKP